MGRHQQKTSTTKEEKNSKSFIFCSSSRLLQLQYTLLSLLIMNNNNNDIDDDIDDDENTNNTHHHHQQRQRQKEKLIRNRVLADSIKIAELEAKEHDGVSLSPQAASVLGELVFLESEKLAFDLKAFAKHRNDRTITKKDVELFVRRSSGDLLECIEDALRKENVI